MPSPIKITYEGRTWPSIGALARAKRFDKKVLQARIRYGWAPVKWFNPIRRKGLDG